MLEHGRPEAARQNVLLDGHDEFVIGGEPLDQCLVERLGEAGVGDGHVKVVLGQQRRGIERNADAVAVAQERHPLPLLQHLAGADRDLARAVGQRHALGIAAGIAEGDRALVVSDGGAHHVAEHRLVARSHDDDVRQRAQVGDVEGAVVGRAVVADQAGAIHREDDVELLQADVMDDLVVGALEEGRVDRADGLRALKRETGREQDRVLLGDADVVVLLGALLLERRSGRFPPPSPR